jgi:hypothetical protein
MTSSRRRLPAPALARHQALFAVVGLLLLAGAAHAQLAPPSGRPLNEARGSVIKGQSAGVQLIGPRASDAARSADAPPAAAKAPTAAVAPTATGAPTAPAAPAAPTAPAAPKAPTAAAAPAPAKAPAAPTAPRWGEPPRGESMATGKRLESPSQGIPLPFGNRPASAPAGSR